jgi:putative ABC transport system permease protein
MIFNYLKIIIRNFLTDKLYTFIIVFGLAIGLATCLIIAQYIHFEMSYDRHVKSKDLIYYSYLTWKGKDGQADGKCFPAIGPFFDRTLPEVESSVRIAPGGLDKGDRFVLRREENGKIVFYSQVDNLFLADSEVMNFFSIPMFAGNSESALREPNTMVITRSLAEKFFPKEDPINKTLSMQFGKGARLEFKITGVTENPLPNSTLQFNALYSMETLRKIWDIDNQWMLGEFQTFIKVHPGSDHKSIERKINEAATPMRALESQLNCKIIINLFPFTGFHFFRHDNSLSTGGIQFTGDKKLITYFAILASLILIISWGNYINLTTARALRRAKEVGLRKVSGASRKNLVIQFLSEFLFFNTISILLAFTIAQLLFHPFARMIGSNATWVLWTEPMFWLVIVLFLILSTLVSGFYPSFIMSDYKPSKVLKGNFVRSQSGSTVRKGLVLVQFGLSVFMIMSIYVISRQLFFMQREDLGMAIDQVVVIRTNELDTALSRTTALEQWKSKVETMDYIKDISAAGIFPGEDKLRAMLFHLLSDPEKDGKALLTTQISGNYFNTMGLELLYGRDFTPDPLADSDKVVINEKAAWELGFKKPLSAIGEKIILTERGMKLEVIGVVKDFNLNLKIPLAGELFTHVNFYNVRQLPDYNFFLVKLSTDDLSTSIANMEKEWRQLFADAPFDYFFLDSYFGTFYKEDQQFAEVFGFFSVIGILLTCMGLFGLSLYDTGSRAKEIGIRKSLGASVKSIMWLFSKDYMKLILIAAVISVPAGILLLGEWLRNYPSHISLQADVVVLPLATMFCIAIGTVGYHTYKTAYMDPVKSLRND